MQIATPSENMYGSSKAQTKTCQSDMKIKKSILQTDIKSKRK